MQKFKQFDFDRGKVQFEPEYQQEPSHFVVEFCLTFGLEIEKITTFDVLTLTAIVPNKLSGTPFDEIEREAAKQIAPLLRNLADEVDARIAGRTQPDHVH